MPIKPSEKNWVIAKEIVMHSYHKKGSLQYSKHLHMKFDLEGILCKNRKLIMLSLLQMSWNIIVMGGNPRYRNRKILNSDSHTKSATDEQFLLKRTWKLTEQLLHNKGHIKVGRQGRDMVLPLTITPSATTHRQEGRHKTRASPWARGSCPSSGTPTLGTCNGDMSPAKYLALKIKGAHIQKTQSTVWN